MEIRIPPFLDPNGSVMKMLVALVIFGSVEAFRRVKARQINDKPRPVENDDAEETRLEKPPSAD
ncbi:MAG: hypothetical protein JSS49_18975 [Planctomycetes bacterium]|nr:hypothetical protein [Planctomycetota bacterium]